MNKRFTTTSLSWVLGVLSGFAGILPATAQDIHAEIFPSVISQDQATSYTIVFDNADDSPQFEPQLPNGLVILGTSHSLNIVASRAGFTRQLRIDFMIQAAKPGKYTIPVQTIEMSNGVKLQTTPVHFEVRQGAAPGIDLGDYQPIMNLHTAKTECYVGESIPMHVQILLRPNVSARRHGLLEIARDNFSVKQLLGTFKEAMEQIGGQPYSSLTASSYLTPLKTGKHTFGPATMDLVVNLPTNTRRGNFLFPQQQELAHLKSGTIDMNVKPLPEEGKPSDFHGAIGNFAMYVRTDKTEVPIGDPLTLTCDVRGNGNFDQLKMPLLPGQEGWKVYPPKLVDVSDSRNDEPQTLVRWEQVVIPRFHHKQIPPLKLSYFDPDKKKYLTIQSAAIPIKVTGEVAKEDPPTSVPSAGTNAAPPKPKETDNVEGMLGLIAEEAFPPASKSIAHNVLFWSVQGGILLLILGWLLYGLRVRRAAAGPRADALFARELADARGDAEFFTVAARWILRHSPSARAGDATLPDFVQLVLSRYEASGFQLGNSEKETLTPDQRVQIALKLRRWPVS